MRDVGVSFARSAYALGNNLKELNRKKDVRLMDVLERMRKEISQIGRSERMN